MHFYHSCFICGIRQSIFGNTLAMSLIICLQSRLSALLIAGLCLCSPLVSVCWIFMVLLLIFVFKLRVFYCLKSWGFNCCVVCKLSASFNATGILIIHVKYLYEERRVRGEILLPLPSYCFSYFSFSHPMLPTPSLQVLVNTPPILCKPWTFIWAITPWSPNPVEPSKAPWQQSQR